MDEPIDHSNVSQVACAAHIAESEEKQNRTIITKEIGIQTIICAQYFVSPQTSATQPLSSIEDEGCWLFGSHTVVVLWATIGLIWMFSGAREQYPVSEKDVIQNVFVGILAALAMFLVFATLQMPDGLFMRPMRGFWRFIKGLSVIYLCLLIFLMFQPFLSVLSAVRWLDPSLVDTAPEKNYGCNCNSWETVQEQIDIFTVAHFGGWMFKALVIRDKKLLWLFSILFEFVELSLRHLFPNFRECWWDHLLLDILGCNAFGIYFGMRICQYMKDREAAITCSIPSKSYYEVAPKRFRILDSLLPFSWIEYKWPSFFRDAPTFGAMLIFTIVNVISDLNVFFLKAELRICTIHWMVFTRTFVWYCVATAGVSEFYHFIVNPLCQRMGIQCWLALAIVITEGILAVKWMNELPLASTAVCPLWVKIIWSTIIIWGLVTPVFIYIRKERMSSTTEE